MFETIMYIVFGLQFMLAACLFIHNRMVLRRISLYQEVKSRISMFWYLLPLSLCCIACILCAAFNGYVYSCVLIVSILFPFMCTHVANEPVIFKRAVSGEDTIDASYRRTMSLGVRSRVLLGAVTTNLLLMYYVFINS